MTLAIQEVQAEQMPEVWRLTHDLYVLRGYCEANEDRQLRHYPHLDGIDETTVWGAWKDDELVGTISLTLDGPQGLHVDEDFASDMAYIRSACRANGQRLCASWRIVSKMRRATMELMDWCLREANGCADVMVADFHPHHRAFYEKAFGFAVVGYTESSRSVNGAPAVLMYGELPAMVRRWELRQKH